MGYACFVEAVKGKSGMNYRVRVGPELTRTLADKLQKQLAEKAKLKGVVQSYP
jgi:cell division septation protein DedD